jgi:diacylglycerol kinase (ATP)
VAVGGDGSINEVASQLIHTQTTLGIVPAGSGNGLAMHLGYGRNISQAIRKLNTATSHRIDCGALNGRYFFNLAGIGFDGLVSNLMNKRTQRGFIPYFTEAFRAGLAYKSRLCVLEINGQLLEEKCFAIAVANGPMYGYNFQIAPGARLDDGLFSVVVMKHAPRWQYFAAVPSSLNGRFLEAPFVQHFSTDKLRVRCEGENYVHIDGEGLMMEDELVFEVIPNALSILTPASRSLYHQ